MDFRHSISRNRKTDMSKNSKSFNMFFHQESAIKTRKLQSLCKISFARSDLTKIIVSCVGGLCSIWVQFLFVNIWIIGYCLLVYTLKNA